MMVLQYWALVLVVHLGGPMLQQTEPAVRYETLEECVEQAIVVMTDFTQPHLALCSPIYREISQGDPT